MNAAIYTRVSTDMQLDGYSLDVQLSACLSLAESRGWQVAGVYTDEGISAKTTDRPQLQRLLRDAKAGRFQIVIVHKLDRLSRSVTDILTTLNDLDQIGIAFVSATESFDFTTPIGKVLLTLLAAFAQWYLDNLSEETKKGKMARAKAGLWSGGDVPFGYDVRYKKDGGDGLAFPHPKDRHGVQRAFELYATGNYSDRDIAAWLNRAGYRAKGRGKRAVGLFTKDTVTAILRNPFYIGLVAYHEQRYPGQHPPLVTPELFEQVQSMRRSRSGTPAVAGRKSHRVYVLAGLAKCARCRQPMRGYSSGKYRYYQDPHHNRMVNCDQKLVRAADADRALGDYLQRFHLPDDWQRHITAALQTLDQTALDTQRERSRLETYLGRLQQLFAWGDLSENDYHAEKQATEQRLQGLVAPVLPDLTRAAALLTDFSHLWQLAADEERKQLAVTLLEAVYLDSGAAGPVIDVTPKPAFAPFFATHQPAVT